MPPLPTPLDPIDNHEVLDAIEHVEAHLIDLLETLTADEWDRPTIVAGWRVRHVAAHLLDTALRRLSLVRDGHAVDGPASGGAADVRAFVDRVNAEGVAVYGRLSRSVLTALMQTASRDYCAHLRTLDPHARAMLAVSWAGEEESRNWFDIARELTERWHHQQQMRLAVGRPGIETRALYHSVLDTFMRVLPHTYRDVAALSGAHLDVRVTGPAGDLWQLYSGDEGWRLGRGLAGPAVATVTIPGEVAWRLFTKALTRAEAERAVTVDGDRALGGHVLRAVAIVG